MSGYSSLDCQPPRTRDRAPHLKTKSGQILNDVWPRILVSGGQVGVDRAALDWAIENGVAHGGWCPLGRRAIDGPLPDRYQLREADSPAYAHRTRLNVRNSDATLIINQGALEGGTRLTLRYAEELGKPCLYVQADDDQPLDTLADAIRQWLTEGKYHTLNVAGPRETRRKGIYAKTRQLLDRALIVTTDPST